MKTLLASLLLALGLTTASGSLATAASRLSVSVSLSSQTMTVTRDGALVETWPVSTARRGYVTPTGDYKPGRMHRMWHSRKYDNAPMPFSIFFHDGYAIHGTTAVKRLGSPASHGCVRLHTANAAKLYAMVQDIGSENTDISITR